MKHISNTLATVMIIAFAVTNGGAFGISAPGGSDTILIVPARPGVLQLAFDLENMRDIMIVSFRAQASAVAQRAMADKSPQSLSRQAKVSSSEPLIHVWTGNAWQYVSFDDFCSLRFVGKPPKTAIVVGDNQTVPKALIQGMAWPCKIERLQTMNAADLINGLDHYLKFSSREWKRLADSHGLKLEDVNAPKRDFNPYNVPRSKMPLETHDFKQEKDDTPPAVLIEKAGDRNNKTPDPSTLK
jgi:hypothetical protein